MHLKPKAPVSKLTKLLRRDRDNQRAARGGTRGGKDQFKWDEIRNLNYKERECYLGYTTKIGYLDKGGKWRKADWYKNIDRYKKIDKNKLRDEMKKQQEEDRKRMEIELGLRERKIYQKEVKEPSKKFIEKFNSKNKQFFQHKDKQYHGLGFHQSQQMNQSTNDTNTKNIYKLKGKKQQLNILNI